jgi:chemotaxis protein methyltransferase CheR
MSAEAAALPRELRFTTADFQRARRLIHQRAGIALSEGKRDMVYGRLARRVRQHGLASVGEYLDFLERSDEAEWQAFTNAMTTNLTAFFREPHHFDTLRELFGRLQRREPLRLWCAAASTGEEPYSLAMTAVEHFGGFDAPVRVLATDIDTQVLATAQHGVYPLQRVEKLEPERLRRFFLRGTGANDGQCRVAEGLRRMIDFRPLNLLDPQWPLRGPFDAVFCRNVMIYFDKATQYRILARIMPLLARDGLFFAGHSESFFHAADLLRPLGRTVYAHPGH